MVLAFHLWTCSNNCTPVLNIFTIPCTKRQLSFLVQVSGYDMATTVAQLVGQPYHEVKHAQYGTLMRMMDKEQPFTISVKTSTYV